MVEKLRFEGIEQVVEVDFNIAHSEHQAAIYAVDEHRAVLSHQSDDNLSLPEVLARIGEHRFSCEEQSEDVQRGIKGY